jgi:hypothetical protein
VLASDARTAAALEIHCHAMRRVDQRVALEGFSRVCEHLLYLSRGHTGRPPCISLQQGNAEIKKIGCANVRLSRR